MLDLVIRNGTIVDGTGLSRYRADLGISGNRIVRIGRFSEKGRQEIDAQGHVVSPGFIDGHTHYDVQIFWDQMGTSSCWQGVTTVVMGNCGFTIAPSRKDRRDLVVESLEVTEDMSRPAMDAGIVWDFETFPEYLDAFEAMPKAINYASYVGHSALRTWVMGDRALSEQASSEDLVAMKRALREAIEAGAIGFSTSRSPSHRMSDGSHIPSYIANFEEVEELVRVLSEVGSGIFQLVPKHLDAAEEAGVALPDWEGDGRLAELAISSRVPTMFGLNAHKEAQERLDLIDDVCNVGGRMHGQTQCLGMHLILSFLTQMPYDHLPEWKEFRALPLEEQKRALKEPQVRERLYKSAAYSQMDSNLGFGALGAAARPADFDLIEVYNSPLGPNPTVGEVARQSGRDPIDVILDLALETDFNQFFLQGGSRTKGGKITEEGKLRLMNHPRNLMTFSDAGAHVGQILGPSLQSYFLARYVREDSVFSLEKGVQMLSLAPAIAWGLRDRGVFREGMIADINIFDIDHVGPRLPEVVHDLPAGDRRLIHRTDGFLATIVGGEITLKNGEATGATPGSLIRGSLAH